MLIDLGLPLYEPQVVLVTDAVAEKVAKTPAQEIINLGDGCQGTAPPPSPHTAHGGGYDRVREGLGMRLT